MINFFLFTSTVSNRVEQKFKKKKVSITKRKRKKRINRHWLALTLKTEEFLWSVLPSYKCTLRTFCDTLPDLSCCPHTQKHTLAYAQKEINQSPSCLVSQGERVFVYTLSLWRANLFFKKQQSGGKNCKVLLSVSSWENLLNSLIKTRRGVR